MGSNHVIEPYAGSDKQNDRTADRSLSAKFGDTLNLPNKVGRPALAPEPRPFAVFVVCFRSIADDRVRHRRLPELPSWRAIFACFWSMADDGGLRSVADDGGLRSMADDGGLIETPLFERFWSRAGNVGFVTVAVKG